jgi:hypothetical protein
MSSGSRKIFLEEDDMQASLWQSVQEQGFSAGVG